MSKAPWKHELKTLLDGRGQYSYNRNELRQLLESNRHLTNVPAYYSLHQIIDALATQGLKEVNIEPIKTPRDTTPRKYRTYVRYLWMRPSTERIALSLRAGSHLSHGTAAKLHRLFEPKTYDTIFINREQSPKPRGTSLTQEGINRAFTNASRKTNLIYICDNQQVALLSGKFTNRLGVTTMIAPEGDLLPATDLERTLLDIVVRPGYSGGANSVLQAFQKARNLVDVEKLKRTLDLLDYAYPYHQAVGFYMANSDYPVDAIALFRNQARSFDFFLDNAIRRPLFDAEWRIHYPADLLQPRP